MEKGRKKITVSESDINEMSLVEIGKRLNVLRNRKVSIRRRKIPDEERDALLGEVDEEISKLTNRRQKLREKESKPEKKQKSKKSLKDDISDDEKSDNVSNVSDDIEVLLQSDLKNHYVIEELRKSIKSLDSRVNNIQEHSSPVTLNDEEIKEVRKLLSDESKPKVQFVAEDVVKALITEHFKNVVIPRFDQLKATNDQCNYNIDLNMNGLDDVKEGYNTLYNEITQLKEEVQTLTKNHNILTKEYVKVFEENKKLKETIHQQDNLAIKRLEDEITKLKQLIPVNQPKGDKPVKPKKEVLQTSSEDEKPIVKKKATKPKKELQTSSDEEEEIPVVKKKSSKEKVDEILSNVNLGEYSDINKFIAGIKDLNEVINILGFDKKEIKQYVNTRTNFDKPLGKREGKNDRLIYDTVINGKRLQLQKTPKEGEDIKEFRYFVSGLFLIKVADALQQSQE